MRAAGVPVVRIEYWKSKKGKSDENREEKNAEKKLSKDSLRVTTPHPPKKEEQGASENSARCFSLFQKSWGYRVSGRTGRC